MQVIKRNGRKEPFNYEKIEKVIRFACESEEKIQEFINDLEMNIKNNITTKEIQKTLIDLAIEKTTVEETYWQYVAAKFLLYDLYKVAAINRDYNYFGYGDFKELVIKLTELGLYGDYLLENYSHNDLDELGRYIKTERDNDLEYASIKLLSDKYLIKNFNKETLELPQERFMIVAMTLGCAEKKEDRLYWVKQFYDVLSKREVMTATPTLLNSGRPKTQLSSCFIMSVDDDLWSIYDVNQNAAQLSKYSGGIGLYVGGIRSRNASIRNIKGASNGVMPWLKGYNNTAISVDQLGSRAGAIAVYLDVWHPDVFDFLDGKKNNGDERNKIHDLFPALSIPDLFMKKVEERDKWYLIDPHEIYSKKGWRLEDFYGEEWEKRYDELIKDEEINKKEVEAIEIMRKFISSVHETGTPYVFYRDTVNDDNPNKHAGMIYSSNLCVTGDTKLLTSKGYIDAKTLYESQKDLKVVIDNRTKNYKMNNKGSSIVDAIPMQLTAKKAKTFKVNTKQGFELKATEWHKMYVYRNENIIKIPLKDLKEGDKILVQSGEGSYGEIHEPDLAYITGLIAGDGCINDDTTLIYLYGDKVKLKSKIEKTVEKIINKYLDRKIKHNAKTKPAFQKSKGRYVLSSQLLKYILELFFITKETKTKIPSFVIEGDKETQAAYLSGLYQMDGTVNCNEKYKAGSIEITQANKEFLKEIQILLLNMGIYSTIYNNNNEGFKKMPNGKGGHGNYYCKCTYKLSVQDIKSREIFNEIIDLKETDKNKLLEFTKTLKPISRNPKHKYTATVSSIEFNGIEDVYDTSQPDHHSLIFNGIVTGNCTEIMQNMSASKLKEEKIEGNRLIIEKEMGDTVVCNLSSLNLGKIKSVDDLKRIIPIQVRMLDNVIDMNFYPIKEAEYTNKRYRAIGAGVMSYHEYLANRGISWESEKHLEEADKLFENIAFYTIKASMELSKERGAYPLFNGSEWHTGKYFDNKYIKHSKNNKDKWVELKKEVKKNGIRNAYLLAVAPTASISVISGTTAMTDPIYSKFFMEEKRDGMIPQIAPNLSSKNFFLYKEAHLINQDWSIKAQGVRQKWIDQGNSFNLYINQQTKAKDILRFYLNAWKNNVKTVYYVRSKTLTVEECLACQ